MATPGYPNMPPGGGPPMGGPPMGGPPMGGPPMGGPPMGGPPMGGPPRGMQPPMRRGTSKAVPLVVSAGLAVGVFCGLLFGVGKKSAVAASKSNEAKAGDTKPDPHPATTKLAQGSATP